MQSSFAVGAVVFTLFKSNHKYEKLWPAKVVAHHLASATTSPSTSTTTDLCFFDSPKRSTFSSSSVVVARRAHRVLVTDPNRTSQARLS